jgi:hypothetical protein
VKNDVVTLFDFLEELTDRLTTEGHQAASFNIKAGFARGTGGVDVDYIINELIELIES